MQRGFTLIELLVVIALIALLASIVFSSLSAAREKARVARALEELHQLALALEQYQSDHGGNYPDDVTRSIPPGLEDYLPGGNWPNAPWPNTVYDWDNWAPADLDYAPKEQVYQISIRFCTSASVCNFPNEPWVSGFDYNSSAYYCVDGPCRAHSSEPVNHPGYCMNCGNN